MASKMDALEEGVKKVADRMAELHKRADEITRKDAGLSSIDKKILEGIHFDRKKSIFDFPKTAPSDFDKLLRAGLLVGNFKDGFALTKKGSSIAGKLRE